jgi:pimeloyl-ACP methyl ester carboxylesterase
MSASVALLTAVAALAGCGDRPGLIRLGGDPARGVLVNRAVGSRPFDPPDPSRPTVVFVHGSNPLPRLVRFTMAEQLARALARRGGPAVNVLDWDWNAATADSLDPRVNCTNAVAQGRRLAAALRGAGVDPSRVHLIGHSAGAMVATSAARDLGAACGRPVPQLTLLDPATYYHSIVFRDLAAGSAALRVENYWAPGPCGFGGEARAAGVRDMRIDGPRTLLGALCPLRFEHVYVVRWYIATAAEPACPAGFNTSLLLADPGTQ